MSHGFGSSSLLVKGSLIMTRWNLLLGDFLMKLVRITYPLYWHIELANCFGRSIPILRTCTSTWSTKFNIFVLNSWQRTNAKCDTWKRCWMFVEKSIWITYYNLTLSVMHISSICSQVLLQQSLWVWLSICLASFSVFRGISNVNIVMHFYCLKLAKM